MDESGSRGIKPKGRSKKGISQVGIPIILFEGSLTNPLWFQAFMNIL